MSRESIGNITLEGEVFSALKSVELVVAKRVGRYAGTLTEHVLELCIVHFADAIARAYDESVAERRRAEELDTITRDMQNGKIPPSYLRYLRS
jgi:hypothetical protein